MALVYCAESVGLRQAFIFVVKLDEKCINCDERIKKYGIIGEYMVVCA